MPLICIRISSTLFYWPFLLVFCSGPFMHSTLTLLSRRIICVPWLLNCLLLFPVSVCSFQFLFHSYAALDACCRWKSVLHDFLHSSSPIWNLSCSDRHLTDQGEWNRNMFYTNFELSRLDFWRSVSFNPLCKQVSSIDVIVSFRSNTVVIISIRSSIVVIIIVILLSFWTSRIRFMRWGNRIKEIACTLTQICSSYFNLSCTHRHLRYIYACVRDFSVLTWRSVLSQDLIKIWCSLAEGISRLLRTYRCIYGDIHAQMGRRSNSSPSSCSSAGNQSFILKWTDGFESLACFLPSLSLLR